MINKISLRLRLTLLNILLLTICCVGLTFILSISAFQMADVIEATPLLPSTKVDSVELAQDSIPSTEIYVIGKSETTQNARYKFMQTSIIYMILVVLLGGAFTYYFSKSALKPLKKLSTKMKNITIHNLSENLEVPESKDEIADLTFSFNEMSSQLSKAFAMQKRFSQSAAHELRTPLTILKTKVDVFKKKENRTQDEYDKLLLVISTHTNRLSSLVKDLLDLTNMDELEFNEKIDIKEMLTELAEELSDFAKEKNISVSINAHEKLIYGNRNLFYRAFYNIFENAIKYNVNKGKVDINLVTKNDRSIITFSDTGIGIPSHLQELIFEPFYRVDKSRSRQIGGAGLGLSTVKAIIDKHNGEISVSENPNGGTIFKIVL